MREESLNATGIGLRNQAVTGDENSRAPNPIRRFGARELPRILSAVLFRIPDKVRIDVQFLLLCQFDNIAIRL